MDLNTRITRCRLCPRLVEWREEVARDKKREYRDWDYWGKPVPSLGDINARVLIIGLAPGAHGANRTGRLFTGDSSGRWLFRALHKAGFANQPTWERRDDGLKLIDCYITAACHCAPPGNKPLPSEIANCNRYLREELAVMKNIRVVIALGRIAFDTYLKTRRLKPPEKFAHNRQYDLTGLCEGLPTSHNPRPKVSKSTIDTETLRSVGTARSGDLRRREPVLIASYHPSRQNTNTGKLTEPMFDAVFAHTRRLL
jgi:uracil-DNA glycosylase family 4